MEQKPALMDVKEAANYLRFSTSHIRNLINARKIPVIRFGRSYRFEKNELEAWVKSQRLQLVK